MNNYGKYSGGNIPNNLFFAAAMAAAVEEAKQEKARQQQQQMHELLQSLSRATVDDDSDDDIEVTYTPIHKNMDKDAALSVISSCKKLIADGQFLTAKRKVEDLCQHDSHSVSREACSIMADVNRASDDEIKAIKYETVASMQGLYSNQLPTLCKKNNMHREAYFWAAARYHIWGNDEDKELKDSVKKNIPIRERGEIAEHAEIIGLTNKNIPSNAHVLQNGSRWYRNITGKNYTPSPAV
jgi:hypothetical protein